MKPQYPDWLGQLPVPASNFAKDHDALFYFIFWLSLVLFIAIMGVMLYFVYKYRRRPGNTRTEETVENVTVEVAWTVLPLIPLAVMFHLGFKGYIDSAVPPVDAMDIRVKARQWSWEFVYPDGTASPGVLTVPVNKPVRLIMSSEDVLHSFYIPAFRIKRDTVPGMYTMIWFEANQVGKFQGYCTEYCGAPDGQSESGHFGMRAEVQVLEPGAFSKWLSEASGPPPGKTPAEWGGTLFKQYACTTCHSNESGVQKQAPSFVNLWGREERLSSGEKITVDENYIRESILNPQAKIVSGFTQIVMPPYTLNDEQIDAIISYIKTLK